MDKKNNIYLDSPTHWSKFDKLLIEPGFARAIVTIAFAVILDLYWINFRQKRDKLII
ncbi:MAG: hypothetical protein KO202_04880 [Methanobacteriaceae archaeon]|jgi:hypothetical protein|nr:hypothetical protein [Methanobacteriaceae archaeon]